MNKIARKLAKRFTHFCYHIFLLSHISAITLITQDVEFIKCRVLFLTLHLKSSPTRGSPNDHYFHWAFKASSGLWLTACGCAFVNMGGYGWYTPGWAWPNKNKLFAMLPGKLHYNGLLCMQELNLGSHKFLSHL